MYRFWDRVIKPMIEEISVSHIVEIGICDGLNTKKILKYCEEENIEYTGIDTMIGDEIRSYINTLQVNHKFYEETSLSVLERIKDYDVILIDGDHNWYTVYNELKLIEKNSNDGKFPIVFLHDVEWPYGRRDLYYEYKNIPEEYRHPFQKKGMKRGIKNLLEKDGFNNNFNNACNEGGERNGVLTAVEDFIKESKLDLKLNIIKGFYGLGILTLNDNNLSNIIKNVKKESKLNSEKEIDKRSLERNNTKENYYINTRNNNVDIIICVHNAKEYIEKCIESLYFLKTMEFNLIIVDDGSNNETKIYLDEITDRYNCKYIRREESGGYTVAANTGLRESKGNYVVLLNSDTIVTKGWLEKLILCAERYKETGIVGPLSNAAGWQSIPDLFEKGELAINEIPEGLTIDKMGELIEKCSLKEYPRIPLVNGFCYMIKREVIDKIGYFDEVSFERGYGEENDYSIRALRAGFESRVADNCYIYHSKSKSYTHEVRKKLCKVAIIELKNKYTPKEINRYIMLCKRNVVLNRIRTKLKKELKILQSKEKNNIVIYTAITGKYDKLMIPKKRIPNCDYICFTDDDNVKSNFWEIRKIDCSEDNMTKRARKCKVLPHRYLSEYDYSIWVDGNVDIISDIRELLTDVNDENPIKCITHDQRDCIYEEGEVCKKSRKDEPHIIDAQMQKYREEEYPENKGLIASRVLMRKHNNEKLKKVMEEWWSEIKEHSRRDQLSFNYVMWKNKMSYSTAGKINMDKNKYYITRMHTKK